MRTMIASSCQSSCRWERVGSCDLSADLKQIRAELIETVDSENANAGTKQEFASPYVSGGRDSMARVAICCRGSLHVCFYTQSAWRANTPGDLSCGVVRSKPRHACAVGVVSATSPVRGATAWFEDECRGVGKAHSALRKRKFRLLVQEARVQWRLLLYVALEVWRLESQPSSDGDRVMALAWFEFIERQGHDPEKFEKRYARFGG
jgi:hypothetical protein